MKTIKMETTSKTAKEQSRSIKALVVSCIDKIRKKEDADLKGIVINGPPRNLRCECCGKHIDEVEPFGGPGDPLVGDFRGVKLLKNFRSYGPQDYGYVSASWECRDCFVLDDEELKLRMEIKTKTAEEQPRSIKSPRNCKCGCMLHYCEDAMGRRYTQCYGCGYDTRDSLIRRLLSIGIWRALF